MARRSGHHSKARCRARAVGSLPAAGRRPFELLEEFQMVKLSADQLKTLPFHHGCSCTVAPHEGQALWIAELPDSRVAAIAFPWTAIAPGQFVISDLQLLNSNLVLIEEGGPLSFAGYLSRMAVVVCSLPWQKEARKARLHS